MNTVKKSLLIGLATLSLGAALAPAHAQEGRHGHAANTEAMQSRMEAMRAKHAERSAGRLAKLHDLLKLTAAQEPAWATFAAAMKPAAGAHADRAAMAALPAPERLEQRLAMAKTHVAAMETRLAALKTFYAVLTPEQQKIFDEHAKSGAHGHHRMMKMHKQ